MFDLSDHNDNSCQERISKKQSARENPYIYARINPIQIVCNLQVVCKTDKKIDAETKQLFKEMKGVLYLLKSI